MLDVRIVPSHVPTDSSKDAREVQAASYTNPRALAQALDSAALPLQLKMRSGTPSFTETAAKPITCTNIVRFGE